MNLPALALFERALRLETRSNQVAWARTGLLVVILVVLMPMNSRGTLGLFAAPGLQFFMQMMWVNLVFITLAGVSYFASAITEEKEEGMLGLLRMTDLNPVSILLGKSTSRLVGALILLAVQVPFILLAVSLGGVSPLQIAAAYVCLLAYLFLLANLALVFSVIFRNTTSAAAVTMTFLILFFFGGRLLAGIVGTTSQTGTGGVLQSWLAAAADLWIRSTPGNRLGTIFQTAFAGPVFGLQALSSFVIGAACFGVAWALFDRFTREETEASAPRFLRRTKRSGTVPERTVGLAAITWKDFTFTSGGRAGLIVKTGTQACLIGLIILIFQHYGSAPTQESVGQTMIWVSLVSSAVWLAIEISRVFREEVRWKTLSSLMTLPFSVQELVVRKVAGVLKGTVPLLGFAVLGGLLIPSVITEFVGDVLSSEHAMEMLLLTFVQYIFFLYLTAFLSLVLKRGALALAFAIHYIGGSFLGGIISMLFLFAGGVTFATTLIGFITLVLIVVLHRATCTRLQTLAAQE